MQSVLTGPASHLCQQQQQRRQQHAFAVTSGRCLVECEGRLPPAYRSATGSGSGSAHLLFSCGHTRSPVRAAGVRNHAVLDFTPIARQVPQYACVEDVMTKGRVYTVRPDTTIDEALETLVKERITGMPVIDDNEQVVGVVSDFDMLSLDGISGKMRATGMFPDTNTEWSAFFEVQKLLLKNQGKMVSDVMTPDPMVVRGNTDLEAAARLLLERRIRRMPVVDSHGRLIGIFSRGDVIRAALTQRKAVIDAQAQQGKQ